ncbi:MAG TPA: hypothetical protein VEV20_06465 [Burkholderiales bacterium]|nr:hypothetical protein [Burkholderiales bacterium]
MRSLAAVEAELDAFAACADGPQAARSLLALAEEVLEQWIVARGETPTDEQREGFRLLALHRQGARGEPSFNACRETCREIAYHYNLLCLKADPQVDARRQCMMAMLAKHLTLFVGGKMQSANLGEFCCSSRALRTASS